MSIKPSYKSYGVLKEGTPQIQLSSWPQENIKNTKTPIALSN